MHRLKGSLRTLASTRGILAALFLAPAVPAAAQDLSEAGKLLVSGKYNECIEACQKGPNDRDEEWPLVHAKALLAIGRYPDAEVVVSNGLWRFDRSVRLRLVGFDTANASGDTNLARVRLNEINEMVGNRIWAYSDPPNIVALGRAALLLNADPKAVLEKFYGTARAINPNLRDTYLASGDLALQKHDYALASKSFGDALRMYPSDPDLLFGMARAYEPSAQGKMLELLEKALEQNENHVPSLLLLTDHAVDGEEYAEADKLLDRALKVNPWSPEAWAYRAVLAHLRNDPNGEVASRKKALTFWNSNPAVDHLIGRKLSQDYRFAEGAQYQRRALGFDPDFIPARIQLAEDLLRLGQETEGWELADEVHRQDGYDVTAYNLVMLRSSMEKFTTLTNDHFILRMGAEEARLYGDRALALLERARERLTAKYGIRLEQPTVVEIFPEQKDFGVRTFGLPHNPGFLGVCFGRVVTANSPASAGGDPSNWEAVLWHEFCHVITLSLTKNKMPRWLSEGISVYEELQANPTWGQRMNPQYREMVLGEDLTPVSELSAAFLSPKSSLHVQFAYYESCLVVQFLVERFGFDKLKAILHDLADGVNINDAISKRTAPIQEVEKDFAAYAKAKAEALGPGLDWYRPKPVQARAARQTEPTSPRHVEDETAPGPIPVPLTGSTNRQRVPIVSLSTPDAPAGTGGRSNYWTLTAQARRLVAQKDWQAAKTPLQTLVELYPDQSGPNNAYALLAAAHRALNETNLEQAALEKWAALDADATEAYFRLMELATTAKDWKVVAQNADRFLAVNPLLPQPYRLLGRATENLGDAQQAIVAYQKVLLLDPPDPAEVHFRLANLLHERKDPSARRHLLQALEDAPRFREAHRLLLEMTRAEPVTNSHRK